MGEKRVIEECKYTQVFKSIFLKGKEENEVVADEYVDAEGILLRPETKIPCFYADEENPGWRENVVMSEEVRVAGVMPLSR